MSVSPPSPSTAAIHATIKTLPTVERSALSATELNAGERRRTRRLISAQVRAEPVAQSAPRAASERKRKSAWLFRTQSVFQDAGDLTAQAIERTAHRRHEGRVRRRPGGLGDGESALAQIAPVGADDAPAGVEHQGPAERAVEARHLDHDLILRGARSRPREERDAIGRHQSGEVVGDGSRHAVGERLAQRSRSATSISSAPRRVTSGARSI